MNSIQVLRLPSGGSTSLFSRTETIACAARNWQARSAGRQGIETMLMTLGNKSKSWRAVNSSLQVCHVCRLILPGVNPLQCPLCFTALPENELFSPASEVEQETGGEACRDKLRASHSVPEAATLVAAMESGRQRLPKSNLSKQRER